MLRRSVLAGALLLAIFVGASPAAAGVVAEISLSSQRMTVTVDGLVRHVWPVSTARAGYITPTGNFQPERLERVWHSTLFHGAPMPYSVFFHGPYAIHGTTETGALGRPASHGCVRLLPENARILFELIREHGFGNSRVVITG